MIFQRKDLFTLNYYKKQPYTASSNGMRLRLTREAEKDEDDKIKREFFKLAIWPEPFAYAKTDDALKSFYEFPYSEEGIVQIIDWLNEKIGDQKKKEEKEG